MEHLSKNTTMPKDTNGEIKRTRIIFLYYLLDKYPDIAQKYKLFYDELQKYYSKSEYQFSNNDFN
jgi:hypothetical protein